MGTVRRLLLVALPLALATSCGESSGGPTSPEPSAPEPQIQGAVHLVLGGGGQQSGITGTPLASPVVVRALDAQDRPVSGVTVGFSVTAGGGSLSPSQTTTDAAGNVQVQWTLGPAAGTQALQATGPGGSTLAVTATASAPAPVAQVRIQPDSLVLAPGSTGAFAATALDAQGNVLAGRTVTWTTSNAGVASLGSGATVTAVAQGTATITATVEGVAASAPVRVLPPPTAPVAQVRIEPDSLVLLIGSTGDFDAVALDAQGNVLTGRIVTWTLTNPEGGFGPLHVATLGAGGTVTGVGTGTATVTAKVEGVTATATVRVSPVPVAQVQLRPDSLDLRPRASAELFAVALDAQGNVLMGRPVTWTSSNAGVAAVGSGGTVTGIADGTATITATVEGIAATARVRVRVPRQAPVAALSIRPDSVTLEVGRQRTFFATATDVQGNTLSGREVTWTTSNAQVAAFASGGSLVTALAEGTATITATSEGVTATATVRVVPPTSAHVATVRIQPDSLALAVGSTGDFNAVALDAQGNVLTGRTVVWTSANSRVASVGAGGSVTGVAQGATQVTATVEGVAATASVRVFRVPVAQVRIQPDSLVLAPGSTGAFTATALDAQGNALAGRTVVWTTSNTGVAALGSGATVTAVAQGTATISATVEGVTASASVRVLPPPSVPVARVRIQPDSLALMVGTAGDFDAVALDAQGNVLTGRIVTWTLTNPDGGFGGTIHVASLGESGAVNGLRPGTATVTAKVEGVTATATVRVFPVPVAQVQVRPDSLDLLPRASADLSAVALDAQGNVLTGRPVAWSSSNAGVAAVGGTGTVAGIAEGTATITATVEGVAATARVRVRVPPPAPVAALDVNPDSVTLEVGRQRTFFATATDAQGNTLSGRTVTWSTSNPQVAAFAAGGSLVTALAEGTTTITATSEGISVTATVRVVTPAPKVATVRVTPDTLSMFPGDSVQFRAAAYDAQGNAMTGLPVSWSGSSGYGTGAQVNRSSGMVTAVAEGTTTVRATVGGITGTATVRVRPALLSNVRVTLIQKSVLSGAAMDLSTGSKQVRFTVGFSEAVQKMALRIRSPGGVRIDCGPSDAANQFLKEHICSLEIPGGADPGLWRVEQLVITTSAGTRTLAAADLDAGQVPGRGFDVLGAGSDPHAPEVRTVVSQGRSSGKFWVQFGLIDHVTGVRSSSATLRNLATGQTVTCQLSSSSGALARGGHHLCGLDVPAGERWRLVSVTATDGVGNTATYTPEQIDVYRGMFEYTFLTYDFTS
ncbi:MAG TPA: Ig-like domain-containing protein [Longimicrobiaceae bacterium]